MRADDTPGAPARARGPAMRESVERAPIPDLEQELLRLRQEEIMRGTIEREMRTIERRYWDAVQRKDADKAIELSDDSCIVVGAQGVGAIDRAKLGEMLRQASYELKHYTFDDTQFQVRQIADDVAVVAYPVREEMIVDGKPVTLDAFDASVWVRRDGTWRCALHTESVKGDPFGRPRART